MKEVETTILRVVFRKIGVVPCVTISQKTLSLEGTVVDHTVRDAGLGYI